MPRRFWQVVEKHKVNIFYTAPTAIRALMGAGPEFADKYDDAVAAAARLGGRADQSRGLALVPQACRQGPLRDRRHLVADRDRRPHDHAAAGRDRDEAGVGDEAVLRRAAGGAVARGQAAGADQGRGRARHRRQLAGADAHGLWRPPAVRRDLLLDLQGLLLHRRRLPARRGRLLLDHRPRRRRAQRLRATASAPPRSRARWSRIPRSPRPRWSAIRTTSRGRASTATSP